MSTVSTQLKAYITELFLYDREDVHLTDDLRLFEERIIDSMGIFRLITFMNETFGIKIPAEEIVIEHFQTVADMSRLVEGHLEAGPVEQNPFAAFTG